MIEKVQFRNFKAYRSLDLELEPLTVLVGPNASGKTTLLEGLRLASDVAGRGIDLYQRVNADGAGHQEVIPGIRSYGVTSDVELGFSGKWEGVRGSASLHATPLQGGDGKPEQDYWTFRVAGSWMGRSLARSSESRERVAELETFRKSLSATKVLRFDARRLAEASYSEDAVPEVGGDGSGLAAVLAHLKLSQDEVFSEIELALKQVVPAVRRIRIERAPVEQTAIRTIALDEQRHEVSEKRTLWGNQVVLDMQGARGVSASAAGEGTLMVLGLLTVLKGPAKPRLVLLDDIELALHPASQARLIEALRAIQKRDPELQLIATSHSPFILNYLDPKEVRMTFLAENGFARCEKLTAHPEFEKWKDLMAPGEFWSSVGEDWIGKLGEAAANE